MHIQTVSGPLEPERLGPTPMHEHINAVSLPGFYTGGDPDDGLVERALSSLSEHAITSLVDLTGSRRVVNGHQFETVQRLSSRVPLHVVTGFSFYKDPWLEQVPETDVDQLTAIYKEGAESTVPAGIFGEVGTSLDQVTTREELHLRAVARAHLDTGLAISTHCTLGTMAMEQLAILTQEGADLRRVVIGHLDLKTDIEYLEQVLATGANIAFDTFGKEWFDYRIPKTENLGPGAFLKRTYHRPDHDRITALAELCARGHDEQIVLSCDMSGAEAWQNPATHGRYGYSYLPIVVLPRLKQAGVKEESIRQMLVANPARILAIP